MSLGKKFATFAAVIGLMVVGGGFASAADNDTQTIDYEITAFRTLDLLTSSVDFGSVMQGDSDSADGGTLTYASGGSDDVVEISLDADISGGEYLGAYVVGAIVSPTAASCSAAGTPAQTQAAGGTATASAVALASASSVPVALINGINVCGDALDQVTASIGYVLNATGADVRAGTENPYTATYTIKAASA